MGCDIVTGGGPGLMQAANEGAEEMRAAGRVHSVGIRVELPFEQEVNPFVEQAFEHQSFFSRLRDKFLAVEGFQNLPAARKLTVAWREDYNRYRPHSSLGYVPPSEFAARCAAPSFATLSSPQHSGLTKTFITPGTEN